MKTETNLYLRSLVEQQRADLLNERSCIINRITGSTMSDDEIEDAAFNLSEIGQKIRKFNGFLSDLRQEGHKNELGPQPTPALSEAAIMFIRYTLKVCVDIAKEDLARTRSMPPALNSYVRNQLRIKHKELNIDMTTNAMSEFNAAYPPSKE